MATTSPDRILSLDLIRGVAVMGIFSVNVVAMAMIEEAYFYPPAYGFNGIADRIMWAANFILIDGKMRSLFTMLFGASMLLVMERAEASGRSPARTHLARMAVLLLIGLIHFFFIWWGDILTLYALVGLVAFIFWKLPPRALLLISILLFAWSATPSILRTPQRLADYQAAAAGALGDEADSLRARLARSRPDAEAIARDAAAHRTPLAHALTMMRDNPDEPIEHLTDGLEQTLALMLLGIWGLRSGFLAGSWDDRSYRRTAVGGIAVGLAGFSALALWIAMSGFDYATTLSAFNFLSVPFQPVMAIGYAALIILLFRRASRVRDRIAAVGRAAFTNYLGASIIGAVIFFEFGLGLYAKLSRAEAWLLVPLVWAIMLAWSKPWLDRFNYGPLEWLWRSLSRWEWQPMRKREAALA